MKKVALAVLLASALTGCAGQKISDEAYKNILEVEPAARQMKPQPDVALLYLFSESKNMEAKVRINGVPAMQHVLTKNEFYVFCLPPGKYDIEYVGDALIPNKQEFFEAKAGAVSSREFDQAALVLPPIIFIPGSGLTSVEPAKAMEKIAMARLGTDAVYGASQYRCRKLSS